MERVIIIPQCIRSTFEGYEKILELFECYQTNNWKEIGMDFRGNTWFDANLLAIIFAYVYYGMKTYGIKSAYNNQHTCKLHELLIRNGFAKSCFDLEYKPKLNETVVPFKIFRSNDTYGFADYIDDEIVRYFPRMENRVRKGLSTYIQELFGNAQIHSGCDKVFTCGQYYYQNDKMDFTIVNLGTTIGENVVEYLKEREEELPENNITWAVKPQNSTKRTHSGGIGLSLMHEFIYHNSGKYQIISGNEFWELDNKVVSEKKFSNYFPGTVVNIEINQSDTSYYKYREPIDGDIF